MGKIIKNSSGQVLLSNGGAFEVTAAIDSNIAAGNIKKDVEILGVTGTYEGSDNVVVSANTPKETTIPSGGMLPNVYYAIGRISSNTTFTRNTTNLDSSIVNIWSFGFEVSGTPTITWPSSIVWAGGTAPTISDGNHYEISILDDWAMFTEFEDPTSGYNPPIDDDD